MLITEFVDIKTYGKRINYYRNLGYNAYHGSAFTIPIEHLTSGSDIEVEVECDYCGEHIFKKYFKYLNQRKKIEKDCCNNKECKLEKFKEACLKIYGTEFPMQSEKVKNKSKEVCLEKYGFECSMSNPEVKEKSIKTCLDRYGCENPMQNEDIKDKFKQTILEKYGKEWYPQTDDYKDKSIQTCLQKYGVEYYFNSDDFKIKSETTCLEKYGTDIYVKSDEFREKVINFWDNITEHELELMREKFKQTCLERYGVEHYMQCSEFKEKAKQTLLKNDNIPTSNQQIEVYKIIKTLFNKNDVFLNYLFNYYILDTVLFINKLKIDIEYDGWYWHKDKLKKDEERNSYLIDNNWKILRIKSANKLPTIEQLQDSLNTLVNTEETYQEIILDDWKEVVA